MINQRKLILVVDCSGLPPASSLFTDSEDSSEAEEDRAGLGHAHQLPNLSDQSTGQTLLHLANADDSQHQQAYNPAESVVHDLQHAPESISMVCWHTTTCSACQGSLPVPAY